MHPIILNMHDSVYWWWLPRDNIELYMYIYIYVCKNVFVTDISVANATLHTVILTLSLLGFSFYFMDDL